jgi:cytochrome P450
MSNPPQKQKVDTMTTHERRQAIVDPYSIPLDQIDVSDTELFSTDTQCGYFERLRHEDPVHYCAESGSGPYWSVTRYEDIVQVEKNPDVFSSEPTIFLKHPGENSQFVNGGFITMDGPRHPGVRSVVQPVASPLNLKKWSL